MLKLNVDVFFLVSTSMELGVILHDSKGEMVTVGLKFVELSVEVVPTKALIFLFGLQMVGVMGLTNV